MSNPCLWCWKTHREGTKIKRKHDEILRKIKTMDELPCCLGGCRPYLCSHFQKVISHGLETFGNCNELLSELNRTNHFLEKLHEEVET